MGKDWKSNYEARSEVKNYISYLKSLEIDDPTLLLAYIYHLYSGLFAGGQILLKKRKLANTILGQSGNEGLAVISVENIYKLKTQVRNTMNEIADDLSEDTRSKLIEESKKVFEWNNTIIRSIKGADNVFYARVFKYLIALVVLLIAIFYVFRMN